MFEKKKAGQVHGRGIEPGAKYEAKPFEGNRQMFWLKKLEKKDPNEPWSTVVESQLARQVDTAYSGGESFRIAVDSALRIALLLGENCFDFEKTMRAEARLRRSAKKGGA